MQTDPRRKENEPAEKPRESEREGNSNEHVRQRQERIHCKQHQSLIKKACGWKPEQERSLLRLSFLRIMNLGR